jgi:hypothetical protein
MFRLVQLMALGVIAMVPVPLMAADGAVAEDVYRGELVAYPGPWQFLPRAHIIVVSDAELEALAADPDREMNLSTSLQPRLESLRQVCTRAQRRGLRTLVLAFDQFFAQYRPGQTAPRRLMPDMDQYIVQIAKIGRFAQQFGLGLELSLLSPLEIGPAYRRATGESGRWMHYRLSDHPRPEVRNGLDWVFQSLENSPDTKADEARLEEIAATDLDQLTQIYKK